MRRFFIALTRNPISLLGSAITTASAGVIVTLFTISLAGFEGNPYLGILAYLILPGFFLLGLGLVPAGIVWERRRAQRRGAADLGTFPVIDLNLAPARRMLVWFLGLSFVNIVILATATYKGVEVMDSTEFCGTTCHTVMEPEYTAYTESPHARVKCVACHIGPGASWFVKSKLSGAWQVVATALDLHPRPIPAPIHNLRPARETCEQCHWPTRFVGDRLKVITHYAEDESNTELKTVLLLRVGGIEGRRSHGIHWHVDPSHRIRYRSDPTRERMFEVELTGPDEAMKLFRAPEAPGADGAVAEAEWRVMDCVDCHNRPTHIYRLPSEAIDQAIRRGLIDRSLPYIRREALSALGRDYGSHDEARERIAAELHGFYREHYPDVAAERVEVAARALGEIYRANVFPAMNVRWGTYPDHLGHTDFPGCFRCHDGEHRTDSGEVIAQDCGTCHSLLAMEEADPEILRELQP